MSEENKDPFEPTKEELKLELELRDHKPPRFENLDELKAYIADLESKEHSYGSCVYAMSLAAVAAFNYMAGALGVTGFQAGCADMDIIKRTRNMNSGFRILNYENLLYPQYLDSEHFPSIADLMANNDLRKRLKETATEKLKEFPEAHPNVIAHWEKLSQLKIED